MVNEQQDDWDLYLEQACWGMRSSYNESTKVSPYEVMHIRKPRFPSELPLEEEPAPISLIEPTPDEVADYVTKKQEQLTTLEAKVQYSVVCTCKCSSATIGGGGLPLIGGVDMHPS